MQTFLLLLIVTELTLFLILEAVGISLITKRRDKRENEGTILEDSRLLWEDLESKPKRGKNVAKAKAKASTKRVKNGTVKPAKVAYKVPKTPTLHPALKKDKPATRTSR